MKGYIIDPSIDAEPKSLTQKFMKNKVDILTGLHMFEKNVLENTEKNVKHSIGYYRTVERLFKQFKDLVQHAVFPELTNDWWFYELYFDATGLEVKLVHLGDIVFTVDDEGANSMSTGENASYSLVKVSTKKLSVDDYSSIYGVEPVTVRQWIRRGKIRTAEKAGNEWRIPELTDIPRRGYEEARYSVMIGMENDKSYPDEYSFLEGATTIFISQDRENKNQYHVHVNRLLSGQESVDLTMDSSEREAFELFLLSQREIRYQEGAQAHSSISGKSIFTIITEEVDSGNMDEYSNPIEVENMDELMRFRIKQMTKNFIAKREGNRG